MIVMVSTGRKGFVHYLAGRYPGSVGNLYTPGWWAEPMPYLPYALDNGAYGAYSNKEPWSPHPYLASCDRARLCHIKPLWSVVPDAVGDKVGTIELWGEWEAQLRPYGWPLAFAVQDGMTPSDVPATADVIFVGGSTEWKWRNVALFCAAFPRVHVGRVNSEPHLWHCHDAGAESCDGTGWFRGDRKQLAELVAYIEKTNGKRQRETQPVLA